MIMHYMRVVGQFVVYSLYLDVRDKKDNTNTLELVGTILVMHE